MSTVAYKDGIMAGDSRAFGFDKRPCGDKTKVFRLDDGRLIGVSTSVLGLPKLVRKWVVEGMGAPPLAAEKDKRDFEALIVNPDGSAVLADGNWLPSDSVVGPYYAIGSGSEFALGALEAGLSAVAALEVACKLDVWSKGPITSVKHCTE